MPLKGLPSFCTCGDIFTVNHALSYKKGGFVSKQNDNVRDLFTPLLNWVYHDVRAEPHLIPLTDKQFYLKSVNTSEEARLDLDFDVRITHVNSIRVATRFSISNFRSF